MTQVKICGITNRVDALFAAEAGADLLGFVFYSKSPRNVAPETVRTLVPDIKSGWPEVLCVGLFVGEPVEFVREMLGFCDLDLAQLHGREPPQVVSEFSGRAYKAIRPRSASEAEDNVARYTTFSSPPDLLVDTYNPDSPGGTGQVGDWSVAARVAGQRRILLAGGLTPRNVVEAIRVVRPWGVDVSSGVETKPGRKSHRSIGEFMTAVRRIDQV
jgi:phosphoribosylanthranilate isomerase